METEKLYKYLDFNDGVMMLHYSNLQFTNATQLNDPFDCHPSLIDFSNVPKEACGGWTPEIIEELRRDPFRRTREEVWICSLSKIHDSILMWSYYVSIKVSASVWTWRKFENLKSATKLFSVLLASKRPLITELADKLRLKYPLLPTISPCPTMRLEAIRSIIPISCRRYPKSV